MNIRLFMKEHIAYIIFQVLLVLFIMLLYWLDGFRNLDTAIYSVVMSILLITSFLVGRYVKRYSFYSKVLAPPRTMDVALQKDAKSPEQEEIEKFLLQLYRLYQNEVQSLYASQTRHLQFMNQWVHQMKTPLSVVELLLQEEELDKKSVQEELDRMKRGLETVLMNARLETFEDDMQVEQMALKQLVTEAVSEQKRLFITHRVFPQVDIDDSYIVSTDPKWLRFVLGQFLTNAVKYSFGEGKKVWISAQLEEDGICLCIKDEGIGIPTSDLPRVTKAFFTGENGRKTEESTGMGLFLAKEICDRLGHEMSIRSEVNKGTCASILFHRQHAE